MINIIIGALIAVGLFEYLLVISYSNMCRLEERYNAMQETLAEQFNEGDKNEKDGM